MTSSSGTQVLQGKVARVVPEADVLVDQAQVDPQAVVKARVSEVNGHVALNDSINFSVSRDSRLTGDLGEVAICTESDG